MQETFDREEDIAIAKSFRTVSTPANGVPAIQRFMSCFKCKTEIVADGDSELVKCSECGSGQLIALPDFLRRLNFCMMRRKVSFEDKLKSMYELYKTKFGEENTFDQLSNDDIMVTCLEC